MKFVASRFIALIVLLFNLQKFALSANNYDSKLYISLLNIVTEDESGPRVNDRSTYVIEDLGLSYNFSFNNSAKCTKILYDDSTVWQLNSSDVYPRALSIHLDLNQIHLSFGDLVYIFHKNGNVWDKTSTFRIDELPEDGIRVLSSNEDLTPYRKRNGVSVDYFFNRSTNCTEVSYRNQTLWKFDAKKNVHPNRVYFNLFKQIALIIFPDSYSVLNFRESGSNLVQTVQIVRDFPNVTILTADPSKSTPSENDVSKYHYRQYDFISEYTFNDDSMCVDLKYGNRSFWSYLENQNAGYPKSLCVHNDLNLIFLELKDSINTYKCSKTGCALFKNIPLNGLTQSKLSIITQDDSGSSQATNDPSRHEEKTFGFGTEYVFNPQVQCVQVQYDGVNVWSKDSAESQGQFPKKLFFHIYTRMLIVEFNTFYLVYSQQANGFQFLSKDSLYGTKESDFSLLTNDGTSSKVLPNDSYQLTKYSHGYAAVFMFKDGSNCNQIDFKGETVLRLDEGTPTPKVMYVNWDMKMLLIESPAFFNAYMFLQNRWIQIFTFPESNMKSIEEQLSEAGTRQDRSDVQPTVKQSDEAKDEQKGSQDSPKEQGQDNSSLRGSESKSQSDSADENRRNLVLLIGAVVVAMLLLILGFVVFYYLK